MQKAQGFRHCVKIWNGSVFLFGSASAAVRLLCAGIPMLERTDATRLSACILTTAAMQALREKPDGINRREKLPAPL